MDSIKSQLMDMGFNEAKIKKALEACPEATTLEQVMEWIIKDSEGGASEKVDDKSSQEGAETQETAANMAARKKITVEEAQKRMAVILAKKAEEQRKKDIEDEKRRRNDGQKMAETRAELQDLERIRLAQQIRQEKMEKELHRKQLLQQIKNDRESFKANELKTAQPAASTAPKPIVPKSSSTTTSNECRIALRFPDGSNLVHKFSPKEQLSNVRLFVQMEKNTKAQIEFVAPPNRKLTDSQMDDTLEVLGLCPASRLEVKFTQPLWSDLD